MKRFLALSLCIMLALSAMGCAKEPTAAELYDKAVESNSKTDSMDMTASTVVNMSQQGTNYSQTMDYDFKASGLTSEQIKFYMAAKMDIQGQSIDTTAFYNDGYYYVETSGQKIKFMMNLEEITKQVQQSMGLTPFTSADMKELTAQKQGTDHVITYVLGDTKINDYMDQLLQNMGIDKSLVSDLKIIQMSGEFTINKDGYFTAMKSNSTMEMTVQGQTISMETVVDSTINNPGQPVEVSLPSTDGYTEVDASAIG